MSMGVITILLLTSLMAVVADTELEIPDVDPLGYIVFCPCMGRFGNQADQYLGALRFAKAVNRTLILPPWVEYKRGVAKAVMVPFDTYFKVSPLLKYHRVITMGTFMTELAPTVWPVGERKVFCYTERHGKETGTSSCNAKDGNPFGPFWDNHGIDFVESVLYKPLYYDPQSHRDMDQWNSRYPPSEFPVWAFTGAPGAFPVKTSDEKLQHYITWTDAYTQQAAQLVLENVPDGLFVGIHLRNGGDFEKACKHIDSSPNLFAAKQCVGDRGQFGKTTMEMCMPSTNTILEKVKKEVKRIGATAVFVATDNDDLRGELEKAMPKIRIFRQPRRPLADPMLDLCILGQADLFIGNCISSFTAFVKRSRDVKGLPSEFWAFERLHKDKVESIQKTQTKQEL